MTAQTVNVKPLEWCEPTRENNWTHGAKTIVGTYYVHIDGGKHQAWLEWFEDGREDWVAEPCSSLQAAKAAAQADYEARILSAIDTTDLDAHIGAELEQAAEAGYVACAETRHVTLGQKVEAAILALQPTALQALERVRREARVEGMERGNLHLTGIVTTAFGDMIDVVGYPPDTLMLVSVIGQSGLKPARILLWHQLYTKALPELEAQGEVVVCPVPMAGRHLNVTAAIRALIEAERGKP